MGRLRKNIIHLIILTLSSGVMAQVILEQGKSEYVFFDASGKLTYKKDALGNRLPDFSHVGYHSGEKAIPDVPVVISLEPLPNDNTVYIQNALDKLGTFPVNKNGIRGAILLKKGVYKVCGTLTISHSGVVLRGEGSYGNGTTIIATGYGAKKHKRSLISVGNEPSAPEIDTNSKQNILDDYVPIGSNTFKVESAGAYKTGDRIIVYRPSPANWISYIGCDKIEPRWRTIKDVRWVNEGRAPGLYFINGRNDRDTILKKKHESWEEFIKRVPISKDETKLNTTKQWKAGSYDFYFERSITKIEENRIYIDAPMVETLDKTFGGGFIYRQQLSNRISEVGVENLRLISEFAPPTANNPYGNPAEMETSEKHAWQGIHIKKNTENTWVRNITGNYFGFSLVTASGKRATIQDCLNLGHASRITGGRRYSFLIDGQLNLMQRCIAFYGRHEFVTQKKTAGPNVFVDCIGFKSLSRIGPHQRYSVGTLYDNIKSEEVMESRYRGNSGSGHGWAGTQTCYYNCIAPEFIVQAPPGGISWVLGSGKEDEKNIKMKPTSLYYQQVLDRLGEVGLNRVAGKENIQKIGTFSWVKKCLANIASNL